jgi:lipopolysaccharide transport system ATP-binding protein
MTKVIKVEDLSKAYQLGDFGTGTISRDLERFWARVRGKEDPFLKIGEVNDRTAKGDSDVVWSLKDINFEINQGDSVGILGMRKHEIKRKFEAIVDFAGVERYIDTPVKRYSSGMYVRLAFAVAAHLESEVLIVDEVLAVGDTEFQKKCLGKMGDISKGEGRTVLFVSHNMDAVLSLCNKGIYLNKGQIVLQSTAHDVVSTYLSENNQKSFFQNIVEDLNPQVKLLSFAISETKFNVFDNVKFTIKLQSASPNKISGLCILIYNMYEKRVAIVDFRCRDLDDRSKVSNELTIESEITKINLVPGSYSLGLFINSDQCTGDYLNLLKIEISEPLIPDFLPYPIEVRGAIMFNHTISIK